MSTDPQTYDTYTKDGLSFKCPVTIDPALGFTVLTGTFLVRADDGRGHVVDGVCTSIGDALLQIVFPPFSLVAGLYTVEVVIIKAGFAPKTISESRWRVKKSVFTS